MGQSCEDKYAVLVFDNAMNVFIKKRMKRAVFVLKLELPNPFSVICSQQPTIKHSKNMVGDKYTWFRRGDGMLIIALRTTTKYECCRKENWLHESSPA